MQIVRRHLTHCPLSCALVIKACLVSCAVFHRKGVKSSRLAQQHRDSDDVRQSASVYARARTHYFAASARLASVNKSHLARITPMRQEPTPPKQPHMPYAARNADEMVKRTTSDRKRVASPCWRRSARIARVRWSVQAKRFLANAWKFGPGPRDDGLGEKNT